jgi:hypothetical protein
LSCGVVCLRKRKVAPSKNFLNRYDVLLMPSRRRSIPDQNARDDTADKTPEESERADLVALFRLLLREPPPDHDFQTCPICERYGIKRI